MANKSTGLIYFKDGRVKKIIAYRDDQFLDGIRFECEGGAYMRVRELTGEYKYYKTYVNHDWETMYKRVHDIDRIEVKGEENDQI